MNTLLPLPTALAAALIASAVALGVSIAHKSLVQETHAASRSIAMQITVVDLDAPYSAGEKALFIRSFDDAWHSEMPLKNQYVQEVFPAKIIKRLPLELPIGLDY